MRKVIYIALGASMLFSSCLFTEDEKFSDSTPVRVEATNDACQQALVGAANGWVMEYYPNTSRYGSFLIHMTFTQESVTMTASSNLTNSSSSLYSMKKSNGAQLSFDTYNPILHMYSNPGQDGVGYGGDYEFMIVSVAENLITLKGSKTGNMIYMHRLADDQTFESYINECAEFEKNFTAVKEQPIWVATAGEKKQYMVMQGSGFFVMSGDVTFPTSDQSFTAAAFRKSTVMFNPGISLDGANYTEFILKDNKLVASENENVQIQGLDFASFFAGQTTVSYMTPVENLTGDLKAAVDKFNAEIVNHYPTHAIQSIGFTNHKTLGFSLLVQTKVASRYSMAVTFDENTGAMTIATPEEIVLDSNAKTYAKKNIAAYADVIAALNGTYDITVGNSFIMDNVQFKRNDGAIELTTSREIIK